MKIAKSTSSCCASSIDQESLLSGSDLVMVWPENVYRNSTAQLNDAFILGKERTEQQDVEFPINQLVEIALRAISLLSMIRSLRSGVTDLASAIPPAQRDILPYRYDDDNNLRVS